MPTPPELTAFKREVETFPKVITEALRAVAYRKAHEGRGRAQQILRSKTKGSGRLANSIVVIEEAARKQFVVFVEGDPERPANLALWIERGTVHMRARPYMRPAADAVEPGYQREMAAAAQGALNHLAERF